MADDIDPQQQNRGEEPAGSAARQPDPGSLLTAAREARGVSTADIARDLGLTETAVKDLEANQFDKFPAGIYVWGYLRNYCKLLELDETSVLEGYSALSGDTGVGPAGERRAPKPAPGTGTAGLVAFVLVVLALLGVAGFLIYTFVFA